MTTPALPAPAPVTLPYSDDEVASRRERPLVGNAKHPAFDQSRWLATVDRLSRERDTLRAEVARLTAPARGDEREFAGDPVVAWRAYHGALDQRDAAVALLRQIGAAPWFHLYAPDLYRARVDALTEPAPCPPAKVTCAKCGSDDPKVRLGVDTIPFTPGVSLSVFCYASFHSSSPAEGTGTNEKEA